MLLLRYIVVYLPIDCGVQAAPDELEHIVKVAIDCLKAQLISDNEAKKIDDEVKKAMSEDTV